MHNVIHIYLVHVQLEILQEKYLMMQDKKVFYIFIYCIGKFERLNEAHSLTSGIKAIITNDSTYGV